MAASGSVDGDVDIRRAVRQVLDPELPMVTIEDLGILRGVRTDEDAVRVAITPTYAGCPAMEAIRADIEAAVVSVAPGRQVVVETVLAPAWSTEDITEAGRSKLAAAGIAPPGVSSQAPVRLPRPPGAASISGSGQVSLTLTVRCPQCGSPDTRELSRFGSTACKALWVCNACAEPFDRFKEL